MKKELEDQSEENIKLLSSVVEPAVRLLGIKLEQIESGYARVSLRVRKKHLNFHGVTFGGVIMSLADHAFGYGVNSLVYPSVASQFNVHFLESSGKGDTLTAECRILKTGGRISVAEVRVTNQKGDLVAFATGTTVLVRTRQNPTA